MMVVVRRVQNRVRKLLRNYVNKLAFKLNIPKPILAINQIMANNPGTTTAGLLKKVLLTREALRLPKGYRIEIAVRLQREYESLEPSLGTAFREGGKDDNSVGIHKRR